MGQTFSHVYTGPDTKWGLKKNTPCNIARKRAGGVVIRTGAKRSFLVSTTQVTKT